MSSYPRFYWIAGGVPKAGGIDDLADLFPRVAGAYLIGFAIMAWRAAENERGFAETSTLAVFRITLFNPAIWIGAVSTLTIARATAGAGLLPSAVFVAGVELGSLAWYLAVIFGATRVPSSWRRHIERAAVIVIGATGAWLVGSILRD
jgi:arginine exporter protein ArgO